MHEYLCENMGLSAVPYRPEEGISSSGVLADFVQPPCVLERKTRRCGEATSTLILRSRC